ncbi:MAG: hypothetical protein ACK4QL_06690 [Pseudanabaenaceae cyanobacterium]
MFKSVSFVVSGVVAAIAWGGAAYANQFVVYVPNLDPTRVPQVRTIAPDGFYSTLENGQRVFQVGRFNNLNLAQQRAQQVRQAGFPAEIRSAPPRVATVPPPAPIPVEPYPRPTPLPGVPPAVDPPPQPIEVNRPSQPQPVSSLPPAPVDTPPPDDHRYVVIIPGNSQQELEIVKQIAPQARLRTSHRGPYIEVQRYADRASAEVMSATIRGKGFDARVAYF